MDPCDMINTIDIMHHAYFEPNVRVSVRVFTINLLMHVDSDKIRQYTELLGRAPPCEVSSEICLLACLYVCLSKSIMWFR